MHPHLVAWADLDTLQLDIGVQAVQRVLDIDGAGHLDLLPAGEPIADHGVVPCAVSSWAKAASLVGPKAARSSMCRPVDGSSSDRRPSSQRVSRNGGSTPMDSQLAVAGQPTHHAAQEAVGARRYHEHDTIHV